MGTNESSLGKLSAHTSQKVESTVIWNATQHLATPEQREQGVVDLPAEAREQLCQLLTFEELPNSMQLRGRSIAVVGLLADAGAKCGDRVMLGGAPFFMEALSRNCRECALVPVFAFSRRESVEQAQADGTVRKVAVFRHLGFVEPEAPRK